MNNPFINIVTMSVILSVGLGLLALIRFWQKRRQPTASPAIPIWLRIIKLAGFGLLTFILISLVLMLVLGYQDAVETTKPAPRQVEIPADLEFEVQEVSFISEDGLRMVGWYAPPQNGATIILLHGYGGSRLQMRWHAKVLTEYGYGVLLYDERASGESQGDYRSYGWEDPADVGGALVFLQEQQGPDFGPVGIAGCSIGGQIALQGAAYYPEIGAVWADGPSTIRAGDIKFPTHPLAQLVAISNYTLDLVYAGYLGIEMPPGMLEILPEISPRPIMLVAGGMENSVFGSETPQMEHYAARAGQNAQVWTIAESYHCNGPQVAPDEYARRLVEFFSQALGVPMTK